MLLATARGIGLMPDSADFFSAAENLLSGSGLVVSGAGGTSRPLTLWPPLYPFLLAGGGLVGLTLIETSRWLAALLFAGTILSSGWLPGGMPVQPSPRRYRQRWCSVPHHCFMSSPGPRPTDCSLCWR
ncbi:MAG: hypothetical protein JSU73_09840 [candidate division WOR-3 bacterium]|nr:MAG: hypothetical protein JSU73_09840 [candidate division WOR-3 bacterium]